MKKENIDPDIVESENISENTDASLEKTDSDSISIAQKADEEYIKNKRECIADLETDENYSIEKFDTLIVSLSSGGLVFSVGFVKDIIPNFHKIDLFWLKICWVGFGLSLILNLLSHVTSFYANRYERKALKSAIRIKQNKTVKQDPKKSEIISDRFDFGTTTLNGGSLISFFIAVITLVYFINSNV